MRAQHGVESGLLGAEGVEPGTDLGRDGPQDPLMQGLPAEGGDKLGKMLAFLRDMEDAEEQRAVPTWKAHILTGGRKGTWSLHVTRNWRLTFRIDEQENELVDLDYEDYH